MSMENQLVDLISKLMESQERQHQEVKAQNEKVTDSLSKLRENVHQIKNDYQGQSELVKIIYRDVEQLTDQQSKDTDNIHERIDRHDEKFEEAINKIKEELAIIKPMALSFGKIRDQATKIIVGAATIAVLGIIATNSIGG